MLGFLCHIYVVGCLRAIYDYMEHDVRPGVAFSVASRGPKQTDPGKFSVDSAIWPTVLPF